MLLKEIARLLKGVLSSCERASRQTINMEKSQFMTSRNTSQAMIEYINRELAVPFSKQLG